MEKSKKIIIAGGTGFLGNVLIDYFKKKYDTIFILSRSKTRIKDDIHYVHWDARHLGNWVSYLEDADVLINLTGKSVDCRYNIKNKAAILSSRIDSTNILGEAIDKCNNPPKLWMNASTATIYKHTLTEKMDEFSGVIGSGFSVDIATNWENAFFSFNNSKTRKVALRTSIVLGNKSGALKPLIRLTKLGLGGKQGKGNQKFSWIHEYDFAKSIDFIINHSNLKGAINIVAPTPSTNSDLMKLLRKHLDKPFGIPINKFFLKFGAVIINTETELILKSRNVIPKKLIDNNFEFKFRTLDEALKNLIKD